MRAATLVCAALLSACQVASPDVCAPGDPYCNPALTLLLLEESNQNEIELRFLVLDDFTNNRMVLYRFTNDEPVQVDTIATSGIPLRANMHPDNALLMAANTDRTEIFNLDASAATLTAVNTLTGTGHGGLAFNHPDGEYFFAFDTAANTKTYRVTASGGTTEVNSGSTGTSPVSATSLSGGSVIVGIQAGGSTDNVLPLAFDASNGNLTTGTPFTMAGGHTPREILPSADGSYTFALTGGSNVLESFRLDSGPAFTSVNQTNGNGQFAAGDITPTGDYIFGGINGGSIDRFSVDTSTASTTLLGNFATGAGQITGMTVDPLGRYLFVTTTTPNEMIQYNIQSDGTLLIERTIATGFSANKPVVVAY